MVGTLESILPSLAMPVICSFIESPTDLRSLLLTSRTLCFLAAHYCVHVQVRFGRLLHAPRDVTSVLVDNVALFQKRFREMEARLRNDTRPLAFDRLLPSTGNGTVAPEALTIRNSTISSRDSDGDTDEPMYTFGDFPLRPPAEHLFSSIRVLHIEAMDDALSVLVSAWKTRRDTAPFARLRQLTLVNCRTTMHAVCECIAVEQAPAKLIVEERQSSTQSFRGISSDMRWCSASSLTSLILAKLSSKDIRALPCGSLHHLTIRTLVLETASALDDFTSTSLRTLCIGCCEGDSRTVSLDLNFANHPCLVECSVCECPSITDLRGSGALQSLLLRHCMIHFRGILSAPNCDVLLIGCVNRGNVTVESRHLTLLSCTGAAVFAT